MFTNILGEFTVDLSAITGNLGTVGTAVVSALAVAGAAGLGIMAVRYGGRAVVSFFKSLSK